ncbi:proton-conducting transporter membrane subunit [Amycolatopsis sp. NPDC059090]|uniref:proton-conducting transporter transmembrane domain-containing protein n=1 Tax=Amycolatopsis sp. NPDC059090 TaxID=3346723 RepID=UPI00366D1B63
MTVFLFAPLALPLLAALGYAGLGWRRATAWLAPAAAALILASAIALAVRVGRSGPLQAGLLRADALSAFMLIVIGAVALLTMLASPAHLRGEIAADQASERTAAQHSLLVQLFLGTMDLAVLAADLGVLWVAIEATTIVTAFLVGQRRTRAAVEAAWKYVVICSTGIALALLGTLLLNYAGTHAGTEGLDLASLTGHAHALDPGVTRIAVALLVLGFGAKAGLAPLHAWLPDAHSQAPAPVSALMSGVLLSVAFYAVLRVKVIADLALDAGFARALLAVMALASLAVAATLLLAQRDYKRMLAYSSIEQLGLVTFGAAIGSPLAIAAALLHVLGHGLAKSVLFLGAGKILQRFGTSRIDEVRGLAGRAALLAGCVGFGVLALLGLPPFSLFASELGIARAGFAAGGMGWATGAALVLVLVIAAALVGHTSHMLLGAPPQRPGPATAPVRLSPGTAVSLVGGLLVCAVLGVVAGPLSSLLHAAADLLTRTP